MQLVQFQKVNEDHIDIFYDNLIYEGKDNLNISKIELSFRYYQAFDEGEQIDVPYQINDLKLYNDRNADQNFEQNEIIARSEQIYNIQNNIYHVSLNLENKVKLTQELIDNYDLNNLYLGFDYSNDSTQKVSSSTILKIDPDQLRAYFPGFPELGNSPSFPELPIFPNFPGFPELDSSTSSSTSVIIIGSIIVVILFIILVILLALLILLLLKRKKN